MKLSFQCKKHFYNLSILFSTILCFGWIIKGDSLMAIFMMAVIASKIFVRESILSSVKNKEKP